MRYEVRIYDDAVCPGVGASRQVFVGEFNPEAVTTDVYGGFVLRNEEPASEVHRLGGAIAAAYVATQVESELSRDPSALQLARHWYGESWDTLGAGEKRRQFKHAQRNLADLKKVFNGKTPW